MLAVMAFGIFALSRVTYHGMNEKAWEFERRLQREARSLIVQVQQHLRQHPAGDLSIFEPSSSDIKHSIVSRDQGECLAMGSDITQKYHCRSVEVTVTLDTSSMSFDSQPLVRTYTVDFQYPVSTEGVSG